MREAIDRALPPDLEARRRAARAILEAPPMPVPDHPLELKREIAEARSRGL